MTTANLNHPPLVLAGKLSEAEVRARLAERFPATEATVDAEDRQRLIAQVAAGIAMHTARGEPGQVLTDDQAEAMYRAAVETANEPEEQRPAPWHKNDLSAAVWSAVGFALIGLGLVLLF